MEDNWGQYYENKAAANINALLRKIESHEIQYIPMFDELNADANGYDFSEALDGITKVCVLMAVNPATSRCSDEVQLEFQEPTGKNVTSVRLLSKHRNTFEIVNLLIHYNKHRFTIGLDNPYKCLLTSSDNQIDISNMGQGPIPIWIKLYQNQTKVEALSYVLKQFFHDDKSVTLLHSPEEKLSLEVTKFCKSQNWKTCTFWDMIGSEDENIISLVGDNFAVMETFSRSKNKLVIITK